jgi:heat shock protein beta
MLNSTATDNTGPTSIIFSNHSTGSAYFLNNTIAYNTNSSNSVYLEFVNSATLQNNIIAENRNSSNVLVGYITQRNNIPAYYNNIIDLIPTNWSASNDVQNGVNGNIVGTNLALGLSNTLGLNSSTGITNTLPISCASVATNAGSNTDYGYAVPTTDQRGLSRNGNVDIGAFENQGSSQMVVSGTLNGFSKCGSNPSSNQSIVVSGCNLTNDISISAPTGFEISTNASAGFTGSLTLTQSGGTVASTTIYVRMTASASGSPSGNISLTSTGATSTAIAITGSASTLSVGTANSNQVLCDVTNASDVVLTGASGTIQWQRSSDNSAWTNISSAVNATLTSAQIGTVNSTTYIRAQVTSGSCTGNSNTVILKVNNALAFDGTGDFVPLGTNAALNLMSNLTVEAWVYVPASPKSSINTIFSKNYTNLGNPGYMFGFNNWNTTNLKIIFEDGASAFNSNQTLTAGTWNHAAVVISGNGTIGNFYINGSPAGSFAATLTDASAVAEFIGAMDSSGSYSLKGTLDELRIWNVARTQQEIIDNMDNSLIGSETGLVAYYDFDQGIPGGTNTAIASLLNKTSNALNGTFTGFLKTGTTSNFVSSTITNFIISGAATTCANSTSRYTHPIVGGIWSISNGATATISSTGLLTSTVGETLTISYSYVMNGCSKTDTKVITVNNPSAPTSTTTLNYCQGAIASVLTATATAGHTLQWYTVSTGGTSSTTAPTPLTTTLGSTIYYVSQKNNTSNCESPRIAITVNVSTIPTISGVQNMNLAGNTLQLTGSGTPDATTPWASSNTAVATISSTGVVTSVGTGTTTITYTISSGCSIATSLKVIDCAAPFGNAMNFDGVDDYVVVGDTFENLSDLTTEAWVYWRGSTNAFSEIFTKDLVSAFAITSTNKLHANFGNGSTWDSGLNSTASIPLNTWTHLAVTRQSGVVKLFINGIQDSATTTLSATGQNSSHRVIGAKLTGTSLYPNSAINGKIDEVRFWSTARTVAQIQASMNTELVGNELGLLANYAFNHGIAGGNNTSVTTIVNLVNSASNGTITNSDKSGTNSNLVLGVTANFSIAGATNVCGNSTAQYTHPIVGGSWSVSNGATATISNTGLLTSTTGETVTLSYTYTLNGCSLTDTKLVTIQTPVISGSSTTGIGDQISLTATTTPASSNAWISSNTTVASISNLGVVSALTLGTTSITFTNTNGCTATQTITVVVGATQSPVLTSPAANTTGATTLNISYTLPETPFTGSVKLTFTPSAGGSPIVWTMTDATSVTFSHVVGTDPIVANSTNVITGAPLSFTTYNLTLSYQDANGNPVAQVTNANIQTLAPPSISFSAASFQGIVNTSLVAIPTINTGGTSTYSVSPSLPNGVLISATTGVISGVPTVAISTRQYTVTATNAAGNSSATFNLFIDSDTDGDGIGDTTDPDIDGDGVPNSVEIQQGTSPTTPGAQDTDGDGVPDYIEQQQGTSPTTPGAQDTDGDGVPDYIEQQQGTSPTTPGAQDTDGDGVPDYIEQQQGTSPTTPGAQDTDGDGVPDYIEQQQGTSPTTPGAQDTDGDGVPDYIEQQQGTNPTTPGAQDTDGDGVPDYIEGQQGTNPTTPGAQDTDGDGVPDYIEQQQGTNPTTPGAQDTDGDGVPDYVEQQQGSNPLVIDVQDSDNDGLSNYKEGYNYRNPGASVDTDRDGTPDYLDRDADGDGILDRYDAFPTNKLEWTDTDRDGIGNNADTDDDNDGILDSCDVDTNSDGIPDNGTDLDGDGINDDCDPDKDGDGVNNTSDNCPNSPNTDQADRDRDGKGDVCDTIEINVSQAITPNGDGVNDTWVIYNLGNHPGSIVRVFNANGTQVFYSANYQNNWMGNYQGSNESLPVGSYLYQIDLGGDGSIDAQGWLYITQ